MRKIKLDETPIQCPSCLKTTSRGNSYPLMFQKSWECQYFAFYVLGNYARYDQKMSKVENIFKILFNAALSPQPYLRFSAIHCIDVFCDNYSPAFQTQNIV